jgi:hypothetical protein
VGLELNEGVERWRDGSVELLPGGVMVAWRSFLVAWLIHFLETHGLTMLVEERKELTIDWLIDFLETHELIDFLETHRLTIRWLIDNLIGGRDGDIFFP